jgi:hypothetical protein
MKQYSFLLKPFFFICSLLFATWLVVKIEKIRPSDFGLYESIPNKKVNSREILERKLYLRNLCLEYRTGKIDSAVFDQKLNSFWGLKENISYP